MNLLPSAFKTSRETYTRIEASDKRAFDQLSGMCLVTMMTTTRDNHDDDDDSSSDSGAGRTGSITDPFIIEEDSFLQNETQYIALQYRLFRSRAPAVFASYVGAPVQFALKILEEKCESHRL
jgi:hypothetical protein